MPLTPILDSDAWDEIERQYMIRLSDENLNDPVALGRCAALAGLSPEAFRGRFQSVGSKVGGTQTKGAAT